jgi:Flp pilus assembly protein TadB
VILGRRPAESTAAVEDAEEPAQPAGKGRPTPKRAEARKARRNVTPKNRKEAAALQREKGREERRLARQALLTGDERHLPPRDAGPERRLARDVVDSRFTVGQVFFALIFVAFAVSLVQNAVVRNVANIAALLGLTSMVVDSARAGRRAKLAVIAKFGDGEARGISSYAFMRAFLPRRFRRPPPKVKRGNPVT